jgi:excisionase family DNA binding protein
MATNTIPVSERITLSPKQAAELLGLSKPTLQHLIDSGELPSFQVGARRLITRDALEEMVRSREQKYTRAARGPLGKIV